MNWVNRINWAELWRFASRMLYFCLICFFGTTVVLGQIQLLLGLFILLVSDES